MAEQAENPEFEKYPCPSDVVAPVTFQSITEMECQMASFAWREFDLENFDLCLKTLKYLQSSRPQDSKVFHNVCVAEYYNSKCRKTTEFYRNMLSVCEQANIDVQDIDSIDDVDQCVVFFNRAVILYHLHKYHGAIHILDKVFQFVEPLDEALGCKVCLLLLELYLATHQPKKALGLIGYTEAMLLAGSANKSNKLSEKEENKDSTFIDDLKLKLVQCKAQCYTMMKTAKPCKREVKALMVSCSKPQQIAAFIIKSQMEYQRGNYRKAIKILNSPEWPDDYSQYFLETGDCLQAVYYNNLGCIQYHMGKPSLGAFYIQRGIKELNNEIAKLRIKDAGEGGSSSQPLHTLSLSVQRKLVYNLAMQHVQRQKYQEAFNCFVKVSDYYSDNPRLWLRIAECCIQFHRQQNNGGCKSYQPVKSVVGSGDHKKIILNPAVEPNTKNLSECVSGASLTLAFAMRALKNALVLLPKNSPLSEGKEDSSATPQPAEEKDSSLLQDSSVLPCNALSAAEIQNLRNAVLVASSYVSLRLGDLILAHEYAVQLLAQPKVSEAHMYLAHMYAGEALVYMDKITEAVEHFNPELFTGISVKLPADSGDVPAKSSNKSDTPSSESKSDDISHVASGSRSRNGWFPENISAARNLSQYNLAVVYAIREEWTKAINLVSEMIDCEDSPPQAKALMIYIHLCRGSTDIALSYLNKSMPAHMPEGSPNTQKPVSTASTS